jgi:hypothetical protein
VPEILEGLTGGEAVQVGHNVGHNGKSASKSNPLLFTGLIRKKGQAKLALFWSKRQRNPTLGLHGLKPGFSWFQTQDKPAKNRVYFLTTPKHGYICFKKNPQLNYSSRLLCCCTGDYNPFHSTQVGTEMHYNAPRLEFLQDTFSS